MAQNLEIVAVDEFHLSWLLKNHIDSETITEQDDAEIAEELQLQEDLMVMVASSEFKVNKMIATPSSSSLMIGVKEPEKADTDTAMMEINKEGQSSLSFCEICVERTESDHMFRTQSCLHSFCYDCLAKHALIRLQDPTYRNRVRCPGENCKEVLELETCRAILPKEVIDRWEQALCEEMISDEQVFYCPFKDCSELLVNDIGEEAIRESECPFCHRLFCAQCYVPWHPGVDCEQFRLLNEDERERDALMVMELAKSQKWKRCPKCRFFVERTEGCPHMTCRCKFEFCYRCGSKWTAIHNGCTTN